MRVFLSHSTKDAAFVKRLAAALEAEGITPWRCEVDIIPGDNFVAKIDEGLRDSDLALLVFSPDAAKSAWTQVEWTSVLAREVSESRTRLCVLWLKQCDLPELLRAKVYIDARADQEKGLSEAVAWAKRLRDMRRFAETRAAAAFLDYEPQGFVGRIAYLERLHTALVEKPARFLLHGEPGCGKSTLALKFAWQAQGAFDAVAFQTCSQRSADEIGVELARHLELEVGMLDPGRQIQAATDWLKARRSLLVLDDVWNEDVARLIPGPPCSVLFTSRRSDWPWVAACEAEELKSFSEAEADSVFALHLGSAAVAQHRAALRSFARRVEWLPIAVVVAADLLKHQYDPLDQAAFALRLEALKKRVHDIPALFERAIAARREQERKLLYAAAVCAPESFWLPLAVEIAGLSDAQGRESRDRLVNASLLRVQDRDRQRFQLHALLREQLRSGTGKKSGTGVSPVTSHGQDDTSTPPVTSHGQDGTSTPPVTSHGQDGRATSAGAIRVRHGAYLPHWTREGATYAVNFRLADSLPQAVVDEWRFERKDILQTARQLGRPLTPAEEERLEHLYSEKVERHLDTGLGKCWMRDERVARIVGDALRHFEGTRYLLHAWSVMPNHVHAVVQPLGGYELPGILHSWKSFTAKAANRTLRIQGTFWAPEYFDHLVRDEADFLRQVEYVLDNPRKAGLTNWQWVGTRGGQRGTGVPPVSSHGQRGTGVPPVSSHGQDGTGVPPVSSHGQDGRATSGQDGLATLDDLRQRHVAALERLFQNWKSKWEWKKYVECFVELMPALEFLAGDGAIERVSFLANWGFHSAYRLGELEAAMRFLKLEENTWAERVENEAKWMRQRIYGNQALILQDWGRLDEALALHKKQEALCLELGNKDGLQISHGNQAMILKDWKRYDEAVQLLQKAEKLCLELNLKSGLGYCYWQCGSVAQAQGNRRTAKANFQAALEIFAALKMPRERDAVQADLDKLA